MKTKQTIKIIACIFVAVFLIFGVPIIINECYKSNSGYATVWGGSDVLGYYGTILGSIIAVTTLVVTIVFTKKQLQRESFLKTESEKWNNLKSTFLAILDTINPMKTLKDIADNGIADPSNAIVILQRYQMDCKMVNDQLNAHLNMDDYPKFKKLIDGIADIAEDFVCISQEEINQYSDLCLWKHKDSAFKMMEVEKEHPGTFSEENLAFNEEIIKKIREINYENINLNISKLNEKFIYEYENKYRAMLQLVGSTFDEIKLETQQRADDILLFGAKKIRKVHNHGKEKR